MVWMVLLYIFGFFNLCYFNDKGEYNLDVKFWFMFELGVVFLYLGEGYLYLVKVIVYMKGIELNDF